MKWLNTMIAKLVTDEFDLDIDERNELKLEMDKSTKDVEKTDNKYMKWFNSFFKHPVGVLFSIWGYARLRKSINTINLSNDEMTMEEVFKREMKQKMMKQMLDE